MTADPEVVVTEDPEVVVTAASNLPVHSYSLTDHQYATRIPEEVTEDRKQIIEKTVDSINQTGAIIVNLVCDNSRVNIKTLKLLGMNYTASNQTTALDLFNCVGKRIFALLDVPHLLKIGNYYIFSITKIKPIFLHAII